MIAPSDARELALRSAVRVMREANAQLRTLPLRQHQSPEEVYRDMYAALDEIANWLVYQCPRDLQPPPRPVRPHTPGFPPGFTGGGSR